MAQESLVPFLAFRTLYLHPSCSCFQLRVQVRWDFRKTWIKSDLGKFNSAFLLGSPSWNVGRDQSWHVCGRSIAALPLLATSTDQLPLASARFLTRFTMLSNVRLPVTRKGERYSARPGGEPAWPAWSTHNMTCNSYALTKFQQWVSPRPVSYNASLSLLANSSWTLLLRFFPTNRACHWPTVWRKGCGVLVMLQCLISASSCARCAAVCLPATSWQAAKPLIASETLQCKILTPIPIKPLECKILAGKWYSLNWWAGPVHMKR